MTSTEHRTEEDYARAFALGNQTEQTFMDVVGASGGCAAKIGHCPKVAWPQPRMARLAGDGDGVHYFVAPDVVFVPSPGSRPILAEIKSKAIMFEDDQPFFWLDEKAVHQLSTAQKYFGPTIFAVYCEELSSIDRTFEDFAFVQVADLQPDRVELLKRRSAGKPAFMLPLDLFSPLSTIFTEEFKPDAHHQSRHPVPSVHDERRTRTDPRNAGAMRRPPRHSSITAGASSGHSRKEGP